MARVLSQFSRPDSLGTLRLASSRVYRGQSSVPRSSGNVSSHTALSTISDGSECKSRTIQWVECFPATDAAIPNQSALEVELHWIVGVRQRDGIGLGFQISTLV